MPLPDGFALSVYVLIANTALIVRFLTTGNVSGFVVVDVSPGPVQEVEPDVGVAVSVTLAP